MISVRKMLEDEAKVPFNLLVRSTRFCAFFGISEYYFTNIGEYHDNINNLSEGTLILLPRGNYGEKENGRGEIMDDTGRLDARIMRTWVDKSLAALLGVCSPDKVIEEISLGRNLYHIGAQKNGNAININTFYLNPVVSQTVEGMGYLRQTIPALSRS